MKKHILILMMIVCLLPVYAWAAPVLERVLL